MSNQLATRNQSTALLVGDAEIEIKNAARKLLRLTPGGNRLAADEATDLAVYAYLTGLNPFNNECYYMAKVGPVPGIAGYRVKAIGWLRATSHTDAPRIWEEYRIATTEEADFHPEKGDVAWVCTLYDSVSRDAWQVSRITLGMRYREMGATFQEAYEASMKDVGPCPRWEAVGVVHADEHFSGNVWRNNQKVEGEFKTEMWDRNERAKKRAAKGCYRKGFPEVNLPDSEEGTVQPEAQELKIKIVDELAKEDKAKLDAPKKTEAQLLGELYGDIPQPPAEQPAQFEDAAESEPTLLEKAEAIPAPAKRDPTEAEKKAGQIRFGHNILGETSLDELKKIIDNNDLAPSLRKSAATWLAYVVS